MCLNCGSFGKLNEETQLVSCSQCGQCYHTYCAGINKVRFDLTNINNLCTYKIYLKNKRYVA